MSEDARLKKGRKVWDKVYGDVLHLPPEPLPDLVQLTLKNLFADIWGRDGLSMRDRRLLILGAIAGMGADPSLFEIHMRSAVENGEIGVSEMEEMYLMLTPYCGYPRMAPIIAVCAKIAADKKKKGKSAKKKKSS